MDFSKVQGLGNDFIIINDLEEKISNYSSLAKKFCNRNFGIGGDGLMIVLPSDKADFRMRIINSDGSEPEMCGNGIRCFAKYVYDKGLTKKEDLTVETLAGIIKPKLIIENAQVKLVRVDMGEPRLLREEIPCEGTTGARVINEKLTIDDRDFAITCVSMGNPHCIIFNENPDRLVNKYGPLIEVHPFFPRKTNVEFVEVINDREVKMRVWERGAGITLACGTGACATAVACVLNNKTERQVTVHLLGGDLSIEWSKENNHLYMTGPAELVFDGNFFKNMEKEMK